MRHIRLTMALALFGTLFIDTPSMAGGWSSCGSENSGQCKGLEGQPTVLRYGDDSKGDYFYYYFEGFDSVSCQNWGGDVKAHVNKSCKSINSPDMHTLPGPINASVAYSWTKCASEGGKCTIPSVISESTNGPIAQPDDLVWVRYGYKDRWIYFINDTSFNCSTDIAYGYDPYPGKTKACYYAPAQAPFNTINTTQFPANKCAAEGENCSLGEDGHDVSQKLILARYGYGDTYTYRIASANGFNCSNKTFYNDPVHHKEKTCQYVELPSRSGPLTAQWKFVDRFICGGSGCSDAFAVSYGTTKSNSLATTKSWSESFSESINEGFSLEGVGVKVSATLAKTWSQSDTVTNTLSTSEMETTTLTCNTSQKPTSESIIDIYQFTASADQYCLSGSTCTGAMQPQTVVCALDPDDDYQGPVCLPGYCANDTCTECTNSQGPQPMALR